jgi:long-chain fatty acid transport protein
VNLDRPFAFRLAIVGLLVALASTSSARAQFGAVISGAGPVNRSMAGASVAAPLSPAGAIYWNPATLSGLERSELEAGAELLFPRSKFESRVNAGSLAPGLPPVSVAGSTSSDAGPYPLPTIALAYLPEDSPFAFGFGVFSMAGFGVNYAGSLTNPILTPPPPAGLGFGPIYSEFQVLQITPAVSYRLNENLSVAIGLNVGMASLKLDPGIFAAPDNANGDAFVFYPSAAHGQTAWGCGATAGVYYTADVWAVGASVRSPLAFDLRFNSADEIGRPRDLRFDLDMPTIVSIGGAFTGLEGWVFAVDLRYLDYEGASGFGDQGFAPDGSVRGLGWRSIFAIAIGAQYRPTECMALRAGFSWSENPIPDSQAFVNSASPTDSRHMGFLGASWDVTSDLTLSVAYMHAFDSSIQGPFVSPQGPVPGTSVRSSLAVNSLLFGMSVKFGCQPETAFAVPQ